MAILEEVIVRRDFRTIVIVMLAEGGWKITLDRRAIVEGQKKNSPIIHVHCTFHTFGQSFKDMTHTIYTDL